MKVIDTSIKWETCLSCKGDGKNHVYIFEQGDTIKPGKCYNCDGRRRVRVGTPNNETGYSWTSYKLQVEYSFHPEPVYNKSKSKFIPNKGGGDKPYLRR